MKQILSILLAGAVAAGMAVPVLAAGQTAPLIYGHVNPQNPIPVGVSGWKAGDISQSDLSVQGNTVTYGRDISPNSRANDYINLTHAMFDENGDKSLMSATELRAARVEVKTAARSGSQAIDSVALNQKESRVEIKYARELVKTSGVDFSLSIYLRVDGRNYSDLGVTFVGTVANDVIDVYSSHDSIDLSDGTVAEAMENNRSIAVDLGSGVVVHTKFSKGKKYYGTATSEPDQNDNAVLEKYSGVDSVLNLKTIGLNSTGNTVSLNGDYGEYYVYDKNMKYLGRTQDLLPLRDKYYLANRRLSATGEEPAPEEDPGEHGDNGDNEDPGAPEYDGDGGDNNNGGGWFGGGGGGTSPDTGGGGLPGAAAAVAVVSLGAALATRKGRRR